jgi:hypothetical protein
MSVITGHVILWAFTIAFALFGLICIIGIIMSGE